MCNKGADEGNLGNGFVAFTFVHADNESPCHCSLNSFRQPEGPTSTFHNSLPLPPFGIAGTVSLVPRAFSDLLTSPSQSRSTTTALSLYAAHVSSHCGQTTSATSNIFCLPSYKRHSYLRFSSPTQIHLSYPVAKTPLLQPLSYIQPFLIQSSSLRLLYLFKRLRCQRDTSNFVQNHYLRPLR